MESGRRYPSQMDDKYMLRLPGNLRERIKGHAAKNGRSMNAEMLLVLEAAFPQPAEPETVNERLAKAAHAIADEWAAMLSAIGQDPHDNQKLAALREAVDDADVAALKGGA